MEGGNPTSFNNLWVYMQKLQSELLPGREGINDGRR